MEAEAVSALVPVASVTSALALPLDDLRAIRALLVEALQA
jgi:hypothetical protein